MARHRQAGGVRKLITRTHHERLESKPWVACLTRTGRWPHDPVSRRRLWRLWERHHLRRFLDNKKNLIWYASNLLQGIGDELVIMFHQPVPHKFVWHGNA